MFYPFQWRASTSPNAVVSLSPSKAISSLEHDTAELVASGMVTLNAKLAGIDDDKLVGRIVEIWGFFWDQVLPYVEGALLPLQTDPLLSSLYRHPKPASTHSAKASLSSLSSGPQIDVRTLALIAFRDRVILPLFPRLYACLTLPQEYTTSQPRLQQMLLVLVSQRSQRPTALSLTAPPPQPTKQKPHPLLRALRAPLAQQIPEKHRPPTVPTGAPSFLSAGLPRDRRGRIAQKERVGTPSVVRRVRSEGAEGRPLSNGSAENEADLETPRVTFADPGRERDKELLESLRSPDPETTRMSFGGWGLGAGREEDHVVEEEEEAMDWDHAQAVVERMVGMKADATAAEGWRRHG
ncbi:Target of rapamycin complex 2 subunit bit61 [Grifola frondosa]|uniref:Target of rapamycin complex 2 subunit bit61 n=1 Tax=Grifola frondosa TaxID=5627 RepID=A0A1C7LNB4_GRIFR|nr:Target of rapamycin complex 2 subunit bit61 [Grifola frondosa]